MQCSFPKIRRIADRWRIGDAIAFYSQNPHLYW